MTNSDINKLGKVIARNLHEILNSDDRLLDLMFPPRLMNVKEAAEYLRIPVGTLYQKANEIPHEKVGRRLIFSDRGLIRWMKRSGCNRTSLKIDKLF